MELRDTHLIRIELGTCPLIFSKKRGSVLNLLNPGGQFLVIHLP